MLILDFYNEIETLKKKKLRRKIKKTDKRSLNRYSFKVNGKNVVVLELTKNDLESEDVQTLLKIYKGRVLVSENYREEEALQEFLYNPEEYYQRAILSSFFNQVRAVNKEWNDICIKVGNFSPFKELYEIVRISKRVTILTERNGCTEKFSRDCYYRYGAIVSVIKEMPERKTDVYLNLDEIEITGKLMIKVKDKDFILYPDTRYFDNSSEYQKLLPYNIEHKIICSVFSDK